MDNEMEWNCRNEIETLSRFCELIKKSIFESDWRFSNLKRCFVLQTKKTTSFQVILVMVRFPLLWSESGDVYPVKDSQADFG